MMAEGSRRRAVAAPVRLARVGQGAIISDVSQSTVERFRELFPVTERMVYLNHASTGPMPSTAVEAIAAFADRASREGQVPYSDCEAMVEETRGRLARLLHVGPERIAFTKNTSAGVLIAIGSLDWQARDNVVLVRDDFPTMTYPFELVLPQAERRYVTSDELCRDIGSALRLIDARTRAVAVSWVNFLTGTRADILGLCRACADQGVFTIVDAIQGIGVIDLDWSEVPADFVVSHGAKWLLAPQGTGFMLVNPDTMARLRPCNLGWLSCQWREFTDILTPKPLKPGASRYEEGTKNYLGIAGFGASLALFHEFGSAAVGERVRMLGRLLRERFERAGYEVVTPAAPEKSAGIVTARNPRADMARVFAQLENEACACSLREGMLRVAPHFYNSEVEIERFMSVVEGAQEGRRDEGRG
jgi:selenocysteine lyase/cysteine desulfurase